VCRCTVLSFLFLNYNEDARACLRLPNFEGALLIHTAATYSTLNVISLLLEEYRPETDNVVKSLLHYALLDPHQGGVSRNKTHANDIIQYLCDRYPDLLRVRNNLGRTPLHSYLIERPLHGLDLKTVAIMCQTDKKIVTQRFRSNLGVAEDEVDEEEVVHFQGLLNASAGT
jgi:ankyrin repeat protein